MSHSWSPVLNLSLLHCGQFSLQFLSQLDQGIPKEPPLSLRGTRRATNVKVRLRKRLRVGAGDRPHPVAIISQPAPITCALDVPSQGLALRLLRRDPPPAGCRDHGEVDEPSAHRFER